MKKNRSFLIVASLILFVAAAATAQAARLSVAAGQRVAREGGGAERAGNVELLLTSGEIDGDDGITITLRYSALIASKVDDLIGDDGIMVGRDGTLTENQVTISENVITIMTTDNR